MKVRTIPLLFLFVLNSNAALLGSDLRHEQYLSRLSFPNYGDRTSSTYIFIELAFEIDKSSNPSDCFLQGSRTLNPQVNEFPTSRWDSGLSILFLAGQGAIAEPAPGLRAALALSSPVQRLGGIREAEKQRQTMGLLTRLKV
jgi:hypothetical protein